MGLFDNIFGGGTRDEETVQKEINSKLKESGGKWTSNLNDLVAERDRARSGATTSSSGRNALSQGLGSFGRAVSSIPGNIARDVRMGTSAGLFSGRDKQAENLASKGFTPTQIKDYFDRTAATAARNKAQQDSRRNKRSNDAPIGTPIDAPVDKQGPVYKNPFGSQFSPARRAPAEITPAMRNEALRIFESQRGAGQIPYQMLPYQQGLGSIRRPDFRIPRFPGPIVPNSNFYMSRAPDPYDGMRSTGSDQFMQPAVMPRMPNPRMPMPQPPMQRNPNVSPAFQYAAQNYQRLGGSQRLMDRPMEMMSVAERQRINDMAQGMANRQRPTPFPGKGGQRQTPFPGKGMRNFSPDGMRQSDTPLGRLLPFISQMGLGGFRGSGMPPR